MSSAAVCLYDASVRHFTSVSLLFITLYLTNALVSVTLAMSLRCDEAEQASAMQHDESQCKKYLRRSPLGYCSVTASHSLLVLTYAFHRLICILYKFHTQV